MKRQTHRGTECRSWPALLLVMLLTTGAQAQVPVDENGKPTGGYRLADDPATLPDATDSRLSAADLEELVGPVALYPDDLLAIVLPASTYPLEVVQAARFLEALADDPSLEPDEDWDDSIVALLNYPDVVRMMDDDIDWTWRLGEAVLAQQAEVIAAVESFRDRAYAAGNLKSDERQKVSYDDGVIEIVPVDEEIIYVPYYEPTEVVVVQPRPVYYYYPDPCPVYYYPYPAGYRFRSGWFWGVTTAFTIGWPNHYLHVYHPSYWGHPYYGRYYYGHYYRRPSITIYNTWYVDGSHHTPRYRYRDGDYWRPRSRAGARQYEPRVVNYHYPPGSPDRGRDQVNARRDSVRRMEDGRMDLSLRPRTGTVRSTGPAATTPRRVSGDTPRRTAGTADAARETRRATGEVGRETRRASGDVGRETRRASSDVGRETRRASSDVGRETRRAGGDVGRQTRRATGTVARPSTDTIRRAPVATPRPRNETAGQAPVLRQDARRIAPAGSPSVRRTSRATEPGAGPPARQAPRTTAPARRAVEAPVSRRAAAPPSAEMRATGRGEAASGSTRRAGAGNRDGSRRQRGHDN